MDYRFGDLNCDSTCPSIMPWYFFNLWKFGEGQFLLTFKNTMIILLHVHRRHLSTYTMSSTFFIFLSATFSAIAVSSFAISRSAVPTIKTILCCVQESITFSITPACKIRFANNSINFTIILNQMVFSI